MGFDFDPTDIIDQWSGGGGGGADVTDLIPDFVPSIVPDAASAIGEAGPGGPSLAELSQIGQDQGQNWTPGANGWTNGFSQGAPPGGGGIMDSIKSGLAPYSGIAKDVAPLLGLGTTGMGIYSSVSGISAAAQQNKLRADAQKYMKQTGRTAATTGEQLTTAGGNAIQGGALPKPLEARVQQFVTDSRAKFRSYFAKAGITDSTMRQEYEAWIDQQAELMRGQLAESLLRSGYAGISTAMGPAQGLAQSADRVQGGTEGLIKGANKAIGALAGQA